MTKYCLNCKKKVNDGHDFNWLAFIGMILTFWLVIPVIAWLVYILLSTDKCPICKDDKWKRSTNGEIVEY